MPIWNLRNGHKIVKICSSSSSSFYSNVIRSNLIIFPHLKTLANHKTLSTNFLKRSLRYKRHPMPKILILQTCKQTLESPGLWETLPSNLKSQTKTKTFYSTFKLKVSNKWGACPNILTSWQGRARTLFSNTIIYY